MNHLQEFRQRLRQWLRIKLWLDPPPPRFDPDEEALLEALGDDWTVFEVFTLARGLKSRQERQPIFDAIRAKLQQRAAAQGQADSGEEAQP